MRRFAQPANSLDPRSCSGTVFDADSDPLACHLSLFQLQAFVGACVHRTPVVERVRGADPPRSMKHHTQAHVQPALCRNYRYFIMTAFQRKLIPDVSLLLSLRRVIALLSPDLNFSPHRWMSSCQGGLVKHPTAAVIRCSCSSTYTPTLNNTIDMPNLLVSNASVLFEQRVHLPDPHSYAMLPSLSV